jgi:iron complex outermembrane receptor protein
MKTTFSKHFLSTLAAALALPAAAQTPVPDFGTAQTPAAPPAPLAQPQPPRLPTPPAPEKPSADDELVVLDAITVSDSGVSRANNILHTADIAATVKVGTNPVLTLKRLPGITVNSVDPVGVKVSSGSGLRLRAFGLSALAVAADGIPVPGSGGLVSNSINQYIEAENIDLVEVSPGTADVTTPAYTALGGSINFHSRPPAAEPAALLSGTYGSNNLRRLFARADTGNVEGFSAFVSASDSHVDEVFADKGGYDRRKVDAQLRYDADRYSITAALGYFKADDLDSRPISGAYKQYLGKSQAELAALGILGDLSDGGRHWFYSTVLDGDPNGLDSTYWDKNRNGRLTEIYHLRFEARPSDSLTLTAIPYYQERTGYNRGAVPFGTALQFYADNQYAAKQRTGSYRADITPPDTRSTAIDAAWLDGYAAAVANGTAAAYRAAVADGTDQARQGNASGARYGVPVAFTWTGGSHKIEAGFWLERDAPDYIRYGHNQINGSSANDFDYTRYWVIYYDNHFDARTAEFHLKDTVKFLDDRLTVTVGIRAIYQKFNYDGIPDIYSYYNGITYHKSFTFDDWFQPQIGATLALNKTDEIFANLSRNFSTVAADYIGSTSFLSGEAAIKPEESLNLDFGWRTARSKWSASAAGYVLQYKNRIGSVTPYDPLGFGSANTRTNYANLGDVLGYGVEIVAAWTPFADLRLGASATWQELEYLDNYSEPDGRGGSVIRNIKGKTVTNTPRWLANADVSYFRGAWFAGANVRYVDGAYLTTSNNQSIGPAILFGLGFGYDGIARSGHAALKNWRVALNIENLFDRHWFYANTGTAYGNGSFYVGTPRSVSISVTARF